MLELTYITLVVISSRFSELRFLYFMVRVVKRRRYMAAIGFCYVFGMSVMRHTRSSLFWPASYRSMVASSLVDFEFRAKGIAFYGSALTSTLCAI